MKKLLLVICLASLLLVGCDNYSQPKPTTTSTMKAHMSQQRFMLIPVDGTLSIMVDKKTRVQYLLISEPYLGFMSPFIDQDGKPILFEGELD